MISESIEKITSLNRQISQARKRGLEFGFLFKEHLILCKTQTSILTKSALEVMSDEKSALLIFHHEKSDNTYVCIKALGSITYEFYGDIDELNKQLFMISFLKIKNEFVCFSNLKDEVLFSGEVTGIRLSECRVVHCELTPAVPKNLKDFKVGKSPLQKGLLIFSLIPFLVFVFYLNTTNEPENIKKAPVKVKAKEKPFKALERFYTKASNAPYPHLIGLLRQLNQASRIEGWHVYKARLVRAKGGNFQEVIQLESSFGELKALEKLMLSSKYSIDVDGNIATLVRDIESYSVYVNYARFHVGSFHKWLTSAMNFTFDDVEMKSSDLKGIESKEKNVVIKATKITIPNAYLEDLDPLASILRGKPFSLEEFYIERKPTDFLQDAYEFTVTLAIAGVTNGN